MLCCRVVVLASAWTFTTMSAIIPSPTEQARLPPKWRVQLPDDLLPVFSKNRDHAIGRDGPHPFGPKRYNGIWTAGIDRFT